MNLSHMYVLQCITCLRVDTWLVDPGVLSPECVTHSTVSVNLLEVVHDITGLAPVGTPEMTWWVPGPRLNIKTVLSTYGDFHVKDKMAVRTSYL